MKIVKKGMGYGGTNILKENMPTVTEEEIIVRYNFEINRAFSSKRK